MRMMTGETQKTSSEKEKTFSNLKFFFHLKFHENKN